MNRTATTATSTVVTALLAGAALTACGAGQGRTGQVVDVRPAAAAEAGNPREHLGHLDVVDAPVRTVGNQNEHLAHRDVS